MADTTPSFTKTVTESAMANWVGLAANLIQVGQYLFGLFSGGPDVQDVLNKLDQISDQIGQGFFALRDLILRETARIIEAIATQAQIQELAKASTSYSNLKEYRRSGNRDILEMAYTLSAEPCFYFLRITSPSSLASFVFCVHVRIDVLRSFITPAYYTQAQYIDEIRSYIRHLSDLIQNITQSVESTHQTSQLSQQWGKPPAVGGIRNFWVHTQTIRLYSDQDPNAPGTTRTVEIRRIEFEDDSPRRSLPTEQEAYAFIERDRIRGIQQELDFMGIPEFITIRDNWIALFYQGLSPAPLPPASA